MLPAPVDQRFEFVSPGWIDAARSFLTQFVAQHPELRDATYSMCEAFDDAPPAFDAAEQSRRVVLATAQWRARSRRR